MNATKINARAEIKLRSREPLEGPEPEICTMGGFAIGTKEHGEISFDWETSYGYKEIDKDGHFVVTWEMARFDNEYYETANPDIPFPRWENVVKSPLHEAFYEAGEDEDLHRVKMDVVEFKIGEELGKYTVLWHKFSPEQLAIYNKIAEENGM